MVRLVQDTRIDAFCSRVLPLLYQNEGLNNLLIGILEGLLKNPPATENHPLMLSLQDREKAHAVAFQLPSHNLILSGGSALDMKLLAEKLIELDKPLPAVVGPASATEEFSKIWTKQTGKIVQQTLQQKIMQLTAVTRPTKIPGKLSSATEADLDFLVQWLMDFSSTTLPEHERRDRKKTSEIAGRLLHQKYCFFWEVAGQKTSMTSIGRPSQNGIAVFGVYTPPEHRKKGYASALVADVSEAQLASGRKFCCLYTDATNPTSNKIYQDIGYRVIGDSKNFVF